MLCPYGWAGVAAVRPSLLPGPESVEHVPHIVHGEGGHRVLAGVDADGGAAGDGKGELHVGRVRLVELEVPVAVGGHGGGLPGPEGQVLERVLVGGKRGAGMESVVVVGGVRRSKMRRKT